MENRTLVLGVGNRLLTDEGAGLHVIDYLARHYPNQPGVEYLDGGTLSFSLASIIAEAACLLVVDASRMKTAPGTVKVFENDEFDRYIRGPRKSVHEVGLADLLDMARLSDELPTRRCLIGIEPSSIDWGEGPTKPVAEAIPKAAEKALSIIEKWKEMKE